LREAYATWECSAGLDRRLWKNFSTPRGDLRRLPAPKDEAASAKTKSGFARNFHPQTLAFVT
jgi:hypothetical protein